MVAESLNKYLLTTSENLDTLSPLELGSYCTDLVVDVRPCTELDTEQTDRRSGSGS